MYQYQQPDTLSMGEIATIVIAAVVILYLLSDMFIITRQQHVRMVETFGKFKSVRTAGLSLKWPWPIQAASGNFSLEIQQLSHEVSVKSSDNTFVTVPIRVQFRVREDRAQHAFYRLANAQEQIQGYVVNQVRSTASGMTFEDLFKSRDHFERDVQETLEEKMNGFGFVIENVLVDDPQPSEELKDAFDRVIASKREREAAENEAEAAKIRSVGIAKAEGEALEIKGKAYAKFRQTVAEGNSEAMKKFAGDTGLDPAAVLDFFVKTNEFEAIRDASEHGGRVIFVAGQGASANPQGAMLGMLSQIGEQKTAS